MKRSFLLVMLFLSITSNLFAQADLSDKAFKVPDNIIMIRKYDIKLDKGNLARIELSAIEDMQAIANIDSLLTVFLLDIVSLKDSLSDPLTGKRIDYITDAQGRKKIRFQQYAEKGTSFLLSNGELASLRTSQDTIHIIGIIANPAESMDRVSRKNPRYYHLSFFLNDIKELDHYMHGILAGKITTIQQNYTGKWPLILGTGSHYLKADSTISADKPRGITYKGSAGDYVALVWSVNIQNYKYYFVPSFSVGAKLTLSNRQRTFKWEPGLFWEPHFLFSKDSSGTLHTYRNDFLNLTYAQGGVKDHDPRKEFSFSAAFSLGYLIRRDGDYFKNNTFRLGGGKIQMMKTAVEPFLWFDHFFSGITPAIRITQYF
jgi:hypothetical protein